ncbi:MAG TPA: alpha/beta hydrolase-fold protein [Gemmataceae bacterium]|jgi:hypothetical protein
MRFRVLVLILLLVVLHPGLDAGAAPNTALRFEVTVAEGLLPVPRDGRLLLVLDRNQRPEPRRAIGQPGLKSPPLLGRDVRDFAAGVTVAVDQTAMLAPLKHLADLPKSEYFVQAVFAVNRDLNRTDASGNLYSEPLAVKLDPERGGTVKIQLNRKIPAEKLPAEDEHVKFVKIRSELLSKFHGRPMYLRAGVILPRDFERERERRYPLRVHIGGYGTRFTDVRNMMQRGSGFRRLWLADDTPRMILLHLDGAGPFGDPYQVNSANNGPYGDAVTQELIPHVERTFRGIGRPYARVLDGASTGGWVSLALQIFYPDFFNGAWSHAPDPVDFRAYELINIYEDENAYVNEQGFERPARRRRNGDVFYTVRHECHIERVLGRGDRWELSGKDWCAWNAAFGPRGRDNLPLPLWDGATGKIDRDAIEHWKKYDLRLVLQSNWKTLGPKLRGKLRIWVGESDEFFLNNAVHLLDDFLTEAKPAYEGKITYGIGKGHDWEELSEKQIMLEMIAAIARGKSVAPR